MSEDELYIVDQIKTWVWSGFYDNQETNEFLDDLLEGDVDEAMLRVLIEDEFEKKKTQERDWPLNTDCDKLDEVFRDLNDSMIIAIQNAGYTTDDGLDEVGEIHATQPHGTYRGYCFYHGQDLARAVAGEGLMFAYGDMKDSDEGKAAIALAIIGALERQGFAVEWNGSIQTKIKVPKIQWQRRLMDQRA
ncbi:DUF6891 domain-containing protein [Undibacterium sp.]|jgi:hypothetical protein|uniref:DUF6891 domain-containing protein n=1 Tax=Undibacterium sp. TaxID=1914977 RepID=UPI002C246069|nr:hypothetical protein [Undibacterium sp.]HTD03455.1 hypothetical protein [Undibacterium sp.]